MSSNSSSDRNATRQTISDEALLAELGRVADELGTSPSAEQMDEDGKYSSRTYRKRFETWNDAKEKAGVEPTANVEYSEAELLERLRAFADEVDAAPSKAEMRNRGPHAPSTYASRFGSWTDALDAAGLDPRTTEISESELLSDLRRVADRLERRPTSEEYDERGRYSDSTYFRRFDSWDDALERAGVKDSYEPAPTAQYTTDQLLDELRRLGDVLGHPPTSTETEQLGDYSPGTYRRRFGSWNAALAEAGFDAELVERAPEKHRISAETLLADVRRLADEYGRPPTYQEMEADGRYSGATYLHRFDSWNGALEAAGYDGRKSRREKIPTRELVRELRALAADLGRRPYRKNMEERGPFSGMTYYNRFGSWERALDVAGVGVEDGVGYLTARCDVCADSIREPLDEFSVTDGAFCSRSCRTVWNRPVVRVEADVFDGDDADALGRIAPLLRGSETLVSELLYSLEHSLSFFGSGFEAAEFEDRRIVDDGEVVSVTRLAERPPRELRIGTATLRRLRDRIESVSETPP